MITWGIDPGATGAWAVMMRGGKQPNGEASPDMLLVKDMPISTVEVGGKSRKRIDILGVDDLIDGLLIIATPDRVVMEQVGGQTAQSAASGFEFGVGVGILRALLTVRRLKPEFVTPSQWKKAVKAPKEKRDAVARADELFPDHRHLFRNTEARGGVRPDRAEAALLAYWAMGVPAA